MEERGKIAEREVIGAGRYKLMERLGEGGGGEVYRAFDLHMEREVAIKWVKGEKKRAQKETGVLKNLKHPAVPTVFDVIEEEGKTGIVMEYMKGKNLQELLEEGKLSVERGMEIGIKIAECLVYLHSLPEKIIYQDLKPDNLLIDRQGEVRLVDFDAAFLEREKEGRCMGTYGYSAPEQYISGAVVDEKSDIYAFGMTMYYMLSGRNPSKPPFLYYKIEECNPLVPKELEQIVMECIQEEKEKRTATMEEVLKGLLACREGEKEKRRGKKGWQRKGRQKKIRYHRREEKQILLTEKQSGRLLLGLAIFCILSATGSFKQMSLMAAQTDDAVEEKELVLPLVTYNAAREKIIIRDGTMYETTKDFHMAIPIGELRKEEGVKITVICTEVQSGRSRQKEILVKGEVQEGKEK